MLVKELTRLQGHKDRVWQLAWHPKLPYLASCSTDHTIRLWKPDLLNPDSWVTFAVLEHGHFHSVRSVAWSPDGTRVVSAGFDGLVCVWEAVTETQDGIFVWPHFMTPYKLSSMGIGGKS